MYEEGLSGYTYLERDVDAKLSAANSAQLRLVPAHEAGEPPRVTPPPTGT
jgi:arginine decarboxylase